MDDLQARVVRLESMIRALQAELREVRITAGRALQATAAASAGTAGSNVSIYFARASGVIDARSGTTLGTGTANLLTDDDPLTEGSTSIDVVHLLDADVADNAWLIIADNGERKIVIGAGSCADVG